MITLIASVLLIVLHFAFILSAFVSGVYVCIYTYRMLQEIPPTRRHLANLFPYLIGVVPGLLTPAGNRIRNKLAQSMCVVAAAALGVVATQFIIKSVSP